MTAFITGLAFAICAFSFFAGIVIIGHGFKTKAAIPVLMGGVYSLSAIAVFGALAGV